MTTRIVVYAHRYRRPPPKKKPRAVEIAATVVVHAPKPEPDSKRPRPKAKQPAAAPPSRPPLPTVVAATNQKRLKRLRAELRMAEPSEPSPGGGGVLRPQRAPRRPDTAEAVSTLAEAE